MNTPEPTHFESLYPVTSRAAEIEKMLGFIKQGNSCQVIALPNAGRSTILGLLAYNGKVREHHLGTDAKRFHFVLMNFSEVRKRTLLDVTKYMFLTLIDSLKDRQFTEAYEQTKATFLEALPFGDELVLFQSLKQATTNLTAVHGLTIVFLFDRFEEYIPMLTDDFFANLRVLRNQAKYQFSVVFSLNRPLEESIEPSMMTEFYDFVAGHLVYLPIIDKPGLDFRIKHLEEQTGKNIEAGVLDMVMELTGGFVREVKNCLQVLLATPDDGKGMLKQVQHDELVAFLLSQKIVQRPLFEIWRLLTPSEQDFLLSGTYETSDQDYSYLSAVGLLENGQITIPLFATFIEQHLKTPAAQTQQEAQLTYDAETNEIHKGETVLSDSLTSAEYKLLRFLLLHPDKVLEREEIITAVWSDSASTAGVTDQALDQLIFRLRKKIEQDPTAPHHIQTIKGRGLRFLP